MDEAREYFSDLEQHELTFLAGEKAAACGNQGAVMKLLLS